MTIGNAFTRAGQNPVLILNEEWKIEVAVAIASLKASYTDARKLSPPRKLRNFHNYFVEGMSYCNLAADQIAKAIDDIDSDALQEAVSLIELCGAMIQQALADPNW